MCQHLLLHTRVALSLDNTATVYVVCIACHLGLTKDMIQSDTQQETMLRAKILMVTLKAEILSQKSDLKKIEGIEIPALEDHDCSA